MQFSHFIVRICHRDYVILNTMKWWGAKMRHHLTTACSRETWLIIPLLTALSWKPSFIMDVLYLKISHFLAIRQRSKHCWNQGESCRELRCLQQWGYWTLRWVLRAWRQVDGTRNKGSIWIWRYEGVEDCSEYKCANRDHWINEFLIIVIDSPHFVSHFQASARPSRIASTHWSWIMRS